MESLFQKSSTCDVKRALLFQIIPILFIFSYAIFQRFFSSGRDILNVNLFCSNFTGWSILHFIWFAFMGLIMPECFLYLILFGLLWEIFEFSTVFFRKYVVADGSTEGWWYARWEDVFINAFGVVFGVGLNSLFLS